MLGEEKGLVEKIDSLRGHNNKILYRSIQPHITFVYEVLGKLSWSSIIFQNIRPMSRYQGYYFYLHLQPICRDEHNPITVADLFL